MQAGDAFGGGSEEALSRWPRSAGEAYAVPEVREETTIRSCGKGPLYSQAGFKVARYHNSCRVHRTIKAYPGGGGRISGTALYACGDPGMTNALEDATGLPESGSVQT